MRAFPLMAVLLLAGCETARVETDFDPAVSFSGYRTYAWLPSEAPRGMNPLMFRRIRESIDRSLLARGYSQAEPADFAIAFTIGERDRIRAHDYSYGYGWPGYGWAGYGWGGYGWGGYGWGARRAWRPYAHAVDIYTVTERSLVVDIYDAKSRSAVWHGVTKHESYSDSVNYERLDRAVDAVLAQFPPQPGAKAGAY